MRIGLFCELVSEVTSSETYKNATLLLDSEMPVSIPRSLTVRPLALFSPASQPFKLGSTPATHLFLMHQSEHNHSFCIVVQKLRRCRPGPGRDSREGGGRPWRAKRRGESSGRPAAGPLLPAHSCSLILFIIFSVLYTCFISSSPTNFLVPGVSRNN